jgi:hypothetical protein
MHRLLAIQGNLSLLDIARLMAESFSAMADGFIGCFNANYHYSFWRPVTAIRNGDIDGNPDTHSGSGMDTAGAQDPACGIATIDGSVLVFLKSPTHSPNSADTRLSRFLGSGRITGKPHLTRRWPSGRVTEGLPTIRKQPLQDAVLPRIECLDFGFV